MSRTMPVLTDLGASYRPCDSTDMSVLTDLQTPTVYAEVDFLSVPQRQRVAKNFAPVKLPEARGQIELLYLDIALSLIASPPTLDARAPIRKNKGIGTSVLFITRLMEKPESRAKQVGT